VEARARAVLAVAVPASGRFEGGLLLAVLAVAVPASGRFEGGLLLAVLAVAAAAAAEVGPQPGVARQSAM
jgi:hypothetical protein